MTELSSLITLLEKATGPDRWLDAKIDAALRIGSEKMHGDGTGYDWAWDNFPVWAHHTHARGMCGVQHENGDLGMIWDSQPFTSSIDAAVALAERVLPGCKVSLFINHLTGAKDGSGARASISRGKGPKCPFTGIRWPRVHGECLYAKTAPLALVQATLRALQSKGPEA